MKSHAFERFLSLRQRVLACATIAAAIIAGVSSIVAQSQSNTPAPPAITGSTASAGNSGAASNAAAPAVDEPCSEESAQANPGVQRITLPTSTIEPGATDPMGTPAGRYTLFPIQGLAVTSPIGGVLQTDFRQTDSSLNLGDGTTLKSDPWNPLGAGPTPIFAAAGRILSADHDDVVFATRRGDPNEIGAVDISFVDQGFSTTLPAPLVARWEQSPDFIAVTQGDLDQDTGADGNLHSEVAVVHLLWAGSAYKYQLDVLNYGSGNVSSPDITSALIQESGPVFNYTPANFIQNELPSDNILSISIGDFDGDGNNEIAIAMLANKRVIFYTYQYQTVNGVHSLILKSNTSTTLTTINPDGQQGSLQVVATISTAAGDFDGDGKDELVLGYAKWGLPGTNDRGQYSVGALIFKYNQDFVPVLVNDKTTSLAGGLPDVNFEYSTRPIVQVVSGQFLMAPDQPDVKFGRRQFVLAWNDTGNPAQWDNKPSQVRFRMFKASDDLQTATGLGSTDYILMPNLTSTDGLRVYSITAGGFKGGVASGALPTNSLAVSVWSGGPLANQASTATEFEIDTFAVAASANSGGFTSVSRKAYSVDSGVDYRAKLPLLAYDRLGNSVYLGAPIHLIVQDAPKTDYVLQEPPKHAYWNKELQDVQNLTRFDRNNAQYFNSITDSFLQESTDTVDRTTGGSTYLTAGATATAGFNFGIANASSSIKHDVGLGAGYDYNEHKSGYESEYTQRVVNSHATTDRDDILKGTLKTYDVWRYRVYGTPKGDPLNYFYEIILPGPEISFGGGGQNFDWYQPIHENGNILSYPANLGTGSDPRIPFDIGVFTLPNHEERKAPLVDPQLTFFDGTSGTKVLSFSTEVSNAGSITYSHTLGENYDSQTSSLTSGQSKIGGFEIRVCGSIEFHNSNSWGETKTSVDNTKTQADITLNRAPGRPEYAYPFFPVMYNTTSGTMKMVFAVPNPASADLNPAGYQTFANAYGGLPDPALNLPLRFQPVFAGIGELERWAANLNTTRKHIRGLFFRTAEKNDADGTYNHLLDNPKQGDIVRIEPRVYNFSTAQTAFNTVVQYQVIRYDTGTNNEFCDSPINAAPNKNTGLICPQSARTVVGTKTIPQLGPLQFTCIDGIDNQQVTGCADSAFVNWNTAGFGPSAGGTYEYRVYVVLNPGAVANSEIYAPESAPVPITNVSNTLPPVITAPGNNFVKGTLVYIGGVQGADNVNGIYQVTPISADQFELEACQPSPPCTPFVTVASGAYSGGGTATILDPGQNNEGYREIGITTVPATAADQTAAGQTTTAAQDYLTSGSLASLSETDLNTMQQGAVNAYFGVPLQLRFTAYSTALHRGAAHMLLYDGDPSQGAPAIADKFIHPGENGPQGASVWFTWTPLTTGVHRLYAVLVEQAGASHQAAELDVSVVAQP